MDGGVGFYERVRTDPTLIGITGADAAGDAKVEGGWPEDFSVEAAYPLITFLVPADSVVRPGVRRIRVQVDMWAWPTGTNGGPEKIEAMDEQLLALLDEAEWTQGGVRWQGLALVASEHHNGPALAMRKRRDFDLLGAVL